MRPAADAPAPAPDARGVEGVERILSRIESMPEDGREHTCVPCADLRALAQHVRALAARAAGATDSPLRECCACGRCGRRDGLDAVVSDEVWALLSERAGGVNLLCLWCMDALAAELGLRGPVALHFAGRALHATAARADGAGDVERMAGDVANAMHEDGTPDGYAQGWMDGARAVGVYARTGDICAAMSVAGSATPPSPRAGAS